jgi:hypothetical protein
MPDAPGSTFTPRGLAIGLKNGASLLFDTDRLAWIAWWNEGFLYRTKSGRLWEWNIEGERLWTAPGREAPLVFLGPDGKVADPDQVRERFGSFASLVFEGEGVSIGYTLHGPAGAEVTVEEAVLPTADGWERRVRVAGVPEDYRPVLVQDRPANSRALDRRAGDQWKAGKTSVRVSLAPEAGDGPEGPDLERALPGREARLWAMPPSGAGSFSLGLRVVVGLGE